MSLAWLALAAALVAGLVFFAANVVESGYARASVPQILYFLYLMSAVLVLCVGQQARLAGVLFGAVAAVVSLWLWREPSAGGGRRRLVAEELARLKTLAKEQAPSPLAWESVGDLYAPLEPSLALKAYDEAARLYAKAKVARQELFDKMKRLRSAATAPAQDPDLGACPGCGAVTGRLDYRCAACGRELIPGRALHAVALFNRLFKGSKLDRVTAVGILLLPFLFLLGEWAYGAAWGAWTLALATWRLGPRQGLA